MTAFLSIFTLEKAQLKLEGLFLHKHGLDWFIWLALP